MKQKELLLMIAKIIATNMITNGSFIVTQSTTELKTFLYIYQDTFEEFVHLSIFDNCEGMIEPVLFIDKNNILLKQELHNGTLYMIMNIETLTKKIIVYKNGEDLKYAQFHHSSNLFIYLSSDNKTDVYSLTFCHFDFDNMTIRDSNTKVMEDRIASFCVNDYYLAYNAWSGKLVIIDFQPSYHFLKN